MEARDRAGASDEIGLNGDGLSIPLGGPIYAPNLVGPLTRVPHFESSVVQEFQSLEAELHLDSSQLCDEDISIDELKLFTEEQLLNMALEESLQSDENANNQSELPEENMNAGLLRECEEEVNGHNLEADPASNANRSTNKMTTRKRKKEELSIIEEKSIAKVAEIAKLKQKQEADRAVVQLHAFKFVEEGYCQFIVRKQREVEVLEVYKYFCQGSSCEIIERRETRISASSNDCTFCGGLP